MAKEPATLLTRSYIEALVIHERGSADSLDWRLPLPIEVVAKQYSSDYKVPKFQKYDGQNDSFKEHVVRFPRVYGPTFPRRRLVPQRILKASDRQGIYLVLERGTLCSGAPCLPIQFQVLLRRSQIHPE